MGKLIEGNYKTDQKVIVIDEEISDPASTLQVLGRLEVILIPMDMDCHCEPNILWRSNLLN